MRAALPDPAAAVYAGASMAQRDPDSSFDPADRAADYAATAEGGPAEPFRTGGTVADGVSPSWLFRGHAPERLAFFTDLMRVISRESDPQSLVTQYRLRMDEAFPTDGYLALSRRNLKPPRYRITRSSRWGLDFDPWKQPERTLVRDGGLLAHLIHRGEASVLGDLPAALSHAEPAAEFFEGMGSLMSIPMYDAGDAMNMIVFLRRGRDAFEPETLPEHVWVTNLFGRATSNLVLRQQLAEATRSTRKELDAVGEIQRSLLPEKLPATAGVKLATYYETSEQSGGDYYDFFELPGGRLGVLIADVSGHGVPAAVIMAVTHAIAHAIDGPPVPDPPSRLFKFVNRHLCDRYTRRGGTFVTGFYGVYDPATRKLVYANAGHPPPRVKHDGKRPDPRAGLADVRLDKLRNLPLGIDPEEDYTDAEVTLEAGDVAILYTDGFTESRSPTREMWGTGGLDATLSACSCSPQALVDAIVTAVNDYTGGADAQDDRTLVAMKVS